MKVERTVSAVLHCEYPIEGVQFHSESALAQHGHAMLSNFLATHAQVARSARRVRILPCSGTYVSQKSPTNA